MGKLFRGLLEEGRQRIFLQPLRCASLSGPTETNKLFSQTLLPQTRNTAEGRPVSLRKEGPQGLEFQRQSYRRRTDPHHQCFARDRSEEPDLLQEPGAAECPSRRAVEQAGRRL